MMPNSLMLAVGPSVLAVAEDEIARIVRFDHSGRPPACCPDWLGTFGQVDGRPFAAVRVSEQSGTGAELQSARDGGAMQGAVGPDMAAAGGAPAGPSTPLPGAAGVGTRPAIAVLLNRQVGGLQLAVEADRLVGRAWVDPSTDLAPADGWDAPTGWVSAAWAADGRAVGRLNPGRLERDLDRRGPSHGGRGR